MEKKFFKKVIAQSAKDLQIISACCFEAKVKISEIKNLINSVIKFESIESSKSKNINQKNPHMLLELLTIDVLKKDHKFEIILLFSKNRFITLTTEIIEVTLEDQKLKDD